MKIEFKEFPKTPRLSRECIITEKIDGTNSCVLIQNGEIIKVGSRNGWLSLGHDSTGLVHFVEERKETFLQLGDGLHYGEFWGRDIRHSYSSKEQHFSLFDAHRWCNAWDEPIRYSETQIQEKLPVGLQTVPVLYRGLFDTAKVDECIEMLKVNGSLLSQPKKIEAEGVIIYHIDGDVAFKKTLRNDDKPKLQVNGK